MTTQERLANYEKAEQEILEAQEMRGADRSYRMADLAEVRKAISELQAQLSRENRAAKGRGFRYSVANFNR